MPRRSERGHAEHGDACTLQIVGKSMIVLAGQDNAKEFFGQTDDSLSIRDGMAFLSRISGRDFYFLADTSEVISLKTDRIPSL
jgi:hypothetical protein